MTAMYCTCCSLTSLLWLRAESCCSTHNRISIFRQKWSHHKNLSLRTAPNSFTENELANKSFIATLKSATASVVEREWKRVRDGEREREGGRGP